MSSTPGGLELQLNDSLPYYTKPKPLYGNIVDVSLTTSECTVVTWPSTPRQRKTQKVRSYTFMLSELPPSQASGMLVAAIRTWVDKARAAEFQSLQSGETREDGRHTGENSSNSISPSKQKKQHGHSRNHSKSSTASHSSKYPSKEHDEFLIGPRVTFLNEEDVIAPPPLPPKDARYQELLSPASLHSPLHSPSKKKRHLSQYHHHHQRRKSSDYSHQGHAVDVGLVWWESSLHGQRV